MAVVDMSVWVDVLENASGQYIAPDSSVNLHFKLLPCVGSGQDSKYLSSISWHLHTFTVE